MSDGGKGNARHPMSVIQQEWDNRWDAILQRDQKEEKPVENLNENAYNKQSDKDTQQPN